MSNLLCQNCGEQPASVFITRVVNHSASKLRLCEECARQQAQGQGWIEGLAGEDSPLAHLQEALSEIPLDEIMSSLFDSLPFADEQPAFGEENFTASPLAGPEDDEDDPFDEGQPFLAENGDFEDAETTPALGMSDAGFSDFLDSMTSAPEKSQRCPRCRTTWDRIKQDGRCGCAHCYSTFHVQLEDVMERLQRGARHVGKRPRAGEKRRRRLEHLRTRRDHQLEVLQNRLQDAVSAEKYEEAAKLRDKIKIVSSTIVAE